MVAPRSLLTWAGGRISGRAAGRGRRGRGLIATSHIRAMRESTQAGSTPRRLRHGALVVLFYTIVAAVYTYPLVFQLSTTVLRGGAGDYQMETSIVAWNARQILRDPLAHSRSPLLLPLLPHGRVSAAGVLHGTPGRPMARAGRATAPHHQSARRPGSGHERGAHVPPRVLHHRPRGAESPRGDGLRLLHEPHGPPRPVHLPDGGLAAAHPLDAPSRAPGRAVARCRAARRRPLGPDALRDLSDLRPCVCPDGFRGGVPPVAPRGADARASSSAWPSA